MTEPTHRDPAIAFEQAILDGRLSDFPPSSRYAGNYMYMGTNAAGVDTFKHIDTRQYLPV